MTEKESKMLQAFMVAIRPPEDIRHKLDVGYSYERQCVEMFEIRPDWKDETNIWHHPFARIRYVGTQKVWKLYWLRGNGKWIAYDPYPESRNLRTLLKVIEKDEYGCFGG